MSQRSFLAGLILLIALIAKGFAQCQSYGVDFVDGGSYFQNISSNDDFTFISYFEGCAGEGTITPILVDPNEDEYFCSNIETSPDGTYLNSTCPVHKSNLFSGTWYVVLEGPDFAYTRTFYLTVDVPTTIIAKPTDFFGYTITPNATTLTLSGTQIVPTTASPITSTIPCKTAYKTTTTTPHQATVYSTKTITRTKTARTWTSTSVVITETATCTPPAYPPRPDQKYIGQFKPHGHQQRNLPDSPAARRHPLVERSPDDATTTITETTYTVSSTTTLVLATPTSTEIDLVTSTITSTPTQTVCHGITVMESTVTAPTPTRTRITQSWTTVWITITNSIVRTKTTLVTPAGTAKACRSRGGHF